MKTFYLIHSILNNRNGAGEIYVCDITRFMGWDVSDSRVRNLQLQLQQLTHQQLRWRLWRMAAPDRIKAFFLKVISVRIRISFTG